MADEPGTPVSHPHVDSIQLRLIAEAASGLRGRPVDFVAMPDGAIRELSHPRPPQMGPLSPPGERPELPPVDDLVLIPAFTEDLVPGKPPLERAQIQAAGVEQPIDLLNLPGGLGPADAVFWSESAVEKFLIPYYASVYGHKAARVVGDILEAFHGDREGGGSAGGTTPGDAETYAMAHLPKSEYVMLGPSSPPERDSGPHAHTGTPADDLGLSLAVIYRDPDHPDALNALRLPDFLRRWRRGAAG